MARLPRLVLPGHAHWVIQRGHGGRPVFADQQDRQAFLLALCESALICDVAVLAWALLENEVQLLLVPANDTGLSRLMQAVGRRYVSAYHRRHGGAGTLWDGRFRCALVEPGATLLALLAAVDGLSVEPRHTSAAQRLGGGERHPAFTDPAEYWCLGNTPFEREAAYRRLMAEGPPAAEWMRWRQSALGGWAIGADAFSARVAQTSARPVRPRRPGRPRGTGRAGTPGG